MRTRLTVLLTVVVVAGVLASPVASADEPECEPISDSTRLTADQGCVFIGVPDITLNCDGHRIHGNGDSDGITLEGVSGVTVKNCVIEGFFTGVSLLNASGNTIKGNFLVDNYIAIWTTGISHSNVIKGNDAVGERGIWVGWDGSTYGNVVSGNTVTGAEEGFQFRNMHDSKISDNRAIHSNGPGIQLGDWSSGNELIGNTVVDGNGVGIAVVTDATTNLVSGNLVQGNDGIGIVVTEWSTDNTIRRNRIRDNGFGFAAWDESPDNVVQDNKFCHNDRGAWWNSEDSPTQYVNNKVCGPAD